MLQGTEERGEERQWGDHRAAEPPREHRPRPSHRAGWAGSPSLGPGAESWEEALSPEGPLAWPGPGLELRETHGEASSTPPTCPQLGHESTPLKRLPSSHLLYPFSHGIISHLAWHLEDTGMAAKHHQTLGFPGSFSSNQSPWNLQGWNHRGP